MIKLASNIQPSLDEVKHLLTSNNGNIIPIFQTVTADLLTPVSAYLKISERKSHSFLFESVAGGEKIGRYSFIGADPFEIVKTGENENYKGDPLILLENKMNAYKFVSVPGLEHFTGGAVGYISYDCVQFFEPTTQQKLADNLKIPDSLFMFFDTIIIFDHLHHLIKVVSHVRTESNKFLDHELDLEYNKASENVTKTVKLLSTDRTPLPCQGPVQIGSQGVANYGREDYERFVLNLKHHITEGDIIQAVPSRRIAKPTNLNPFNAYRQLRSLNPSPYMFYVDLKDFQIVGASPEMLVKVDKGIVYTHPIAGTRKRGRTPEEDIELEMELLNDIKERSEHVMLVDLGRNDVNRICDPKSVKVDSLMHVEKYSHVMHIVSNVSGKLRENKTGFDAFRSIFPAGTVTGAPKVRAIQLVYNLEREKRGIYAGAVGYFDFAGDLDTCIAIRTTVFKDGIAYFQAGAGIVYDSVPITEFEETESKLRGNIAALSAAEIYYHNQQQEEKKSILLRSL